MDFIGRFASSATHFTTALIKSIAASTSSSAEQAFMGVASNAKQPKFQIILSQIFLVAMVLQRRLPVYESTKTSHANGFKGEAGDKIFGHRVSSSRAISSNVLDKFERIINALNRRFQRSTRMFVSRIQQRFTAYVASNVLFHYDIKIDGNQCQIKPIDKSGDLVTELPTEFTTTHYSVYTLSTPSSFS
eukprot:jgi/Psemu1/121/gm1.121_g